MKKPLFISVFLLISACSSKPVLPEKDICVLVYDLKKNEYVEIENQKRCEMRVPACSTFKIPLAVMAFDANVLKDVLNPTFEWDQKMTPIEPWNKDQNPTSWMRDSVVWVSQTITPKIGAVKIQEYLNAFDYGNKDISAGIKYAWLTPSPFIVEPMQNSLKVSAYEQVEFLKKLIRSELPVSKSAQEKTLKLMTQDVSPRGGTISGKTGSGFTDSKYEYRLGWFVGHLVTEKTDYIVVTNFTDNIKQHSTTFAGREAKETLFKFLSDKGYW